MTPPRSWKSLLACSVLSLSAAYTPTYAQAVDDTMQQVRTQARSDKRAFVAKQLQLTESQAKAFWPLYESYQKDLQAINARAATTVVDYVNVEDRLTDAAAAQLLRELSAISNDRNKLNQSYTKRFLKAVPGKQAARYFQIENKIRAVEEYDVATRIPLVK